MQGATTYDEDCNLQVTNFVLDSAPKCTVHIGTPCNVDSTQWVIVRGDSVVGVIGRCDLHPVKDAIKMLRKVSPNADIIGVVTHAEDFAEVIS